MARKITKGMTVEVIAGDSKGTIGKVMHVLPDKNRVLIEGVNLAHKHVRPSQRNPQGGRIRIERPIHISNVLPVDSKSNKGARVHFDVAADGSKKRISVGGNEISVVRKAKK